MFPYELYKNISGQSESSSTGNSIGGSNGNYTSSEFSTKTENFAKAIASFLIGFEDRTDSGKIPPEIIILGAIFISKSLLALSLRQAKRAGLNLAEL